MTMKKQEKVLLYRFTDADRLASVKQVMADLKIEVKELKDDDWQEKSMTIRFFKDLIPLFSMKIC